MITVEPLADEDLDAACVFWRTGFRSCCDHDWWKRAFRMTGLSNKPNCGFALKEDSRIVGLIGAIYSQQFIMGRAERLCNMSSWFVLEPYRNHSLRLFYSLIKQPEFHFTNFSANPDVVRILRATGFKPISASVTAVPNLPAPKQRGVEVLTDHEDVVDAVPEERRQIARDHAFPGIRQLAVGSHQDGFCHILFAVGRSRGVRSAIVLDVSDRPMLRRVWRSCGRYFLMHCGTPLTRIETRLLEGVRLPLSVSFKREPKAFVRGQNIDAERIPLLYSESVFLRGC